MLLVSERSLRSPLHNATIASVLRVLIGSLFHKFGFFMDCLRIQQSLAATKPTKVNVSPSVPSGNAAATALYVTQFTEICSL